MSFQFLFYLGAFLLGIISPLSELLPRFRDEPLKALLSLPGIIYLLFSGGFSVFAYQLLLLVDAPEPQAISGFLKHMLIGGFGATLILRARFFTVKVSNEEVAVSPGVLMDALLVYLDRQIDRKRALERIKLVRTEMEGVDFGDPTTFM